MQEISTAGLGKWVGEAEKAGSRCPIVTDSEGSAVGHYFAFGSAVASPFPSNRLFGSMGVCESSTLE